STAGRRSSGGSSACTQCMEAGKLATRGTERLHRCSSLETSSQGSGGFPLSLLTECPVFLYLQSRGSSSECLAQESIHGHFRPLASRITQQAIAGQASWCSHCRQRDRTLPDEVGERWRSGRLLPTSTDASQLRPGCGRSAPLPLSRLDLLNGRIG